MKRLLCFVCCILLAVCSSASVLSLETEFESAPILKESAGEFYRRIKEIAITNVEYTGSSELDTFDVSKGGEIAVGFRNGNINIYDSKGDFRYNIQFESHDRKVYSVLYDEIDQNLIIYYIPEEYLAKISNTGELLEMEQVKKDIRQNTIYRYELIHNQNFSIDRGEICYEVKKPGIIESLFTGESCRVVMYWQDGTEKIIYDDHQEGLKSAILTILFWVAFSVALVSVITVSIRYRYKKKIAQK